MEVFADTLSLGSYAYLVFLHDLEDNTFSVIGCDNNHELDYRGIMDLDDYSLCSMHEVCDDEGNRCEFSVFANPYTQKKHANYTALSTRVRELIEKSGGIGLEVHTEGNPPILDEETLIFDADGVTRFFDTDCEEYFSWSDLCDDEISLLNEILDNYSKS